MPKKSTSARRGVRRYKPKGQKSFELVRSEKVETEVEESNTTPANASTAVATKEDAKTSTKAPTTVATKEDAKTSTKAPTTVSPKEDVKTSTKVSKDSSPKEEAKTSTKAATDSSPKEEQKAKTQERQNTPAQGSASARLAARRQAAQRLQQRSASTLITSEHFAYVRKDLIKIAVFAVLMFTTIIVLYLTLGRA